MWGCYNIDWLYAYAAGMRIQNFHFENFGSSWQPLQNKECEKWRNPDAKIKRHLIFRTLSDHLSCKNLPTVGKLNNKHPAAIAPNRYQMVVFPQIIGVGICRIQQPTADIVQLNRNPCFAFRKDSQQYLILPHHRKQLQMGCSFWGIHRDPLAMFVATVEIGLLQPVIRNSVEGEGVGKAVLERTIGKTGSRNGSNGSKVFRIQTSFNGKEVVVCFRCRAPEQ